MHKKRFILLTVFVAIALFVAACSPSIAGLSGEASNILESIFQENSDELDTQPETAQVKREPVAPIEPGLLAAYESTLINIYEQVNLSVVNINVLQNSSIALPNSEELPDLPFFDMPGFPGLPEMPDIPESQDPFGQSLGSGFVWDEQGHIVTNNHVVEGAEKIEVTFSDGTVVPAELVGADPDSDLAVIRVNMPSNKLHPVLLGDSDQLRVGQLAIAIGNPFGLEGTMTVGIVSALGRSLPASNGLTGGPVYRIPDVIQTDAPINPGNSGGVLLNDRGEVIGVTAAIESPVRANAGIGFVIPSSIVERVVPELIEDGSYAHPYLGISGVSLFPDLAEAMDLERDQRGAMVAEVVPGGPAEKAGLSGSEQQATINGQDILVGGDVITAVDGQKIDDMGDLIAYLSAEVEVGQKVELTILRDGKEIEIQVTLESRPDEKALDDASQNETSGQAWLGIVGLPLIPEVAEAMDLPSAQRGVLIEQIQPASPADEAGLQGSYKPVTINGEEILIGGDVITAVNGQEVASVQELSGLLQEAGPGGEVSLTVIRGGEQITIEVTLIEKP